MVESEENKRLTKHTQTYSNSDNESNYIINNDCKKQTRNHFLPVTIEDSQVLLGFIYISEAKFSSQPTNTYIVCQLFSEKETSARSSVIFNSSSPVYNFSQLVPILLNNELLYYFRENFMLIEFWKIEHSKQSLIGLSKISLHQFYLTYKNPVIFQHLLKKELPAIGTDDWIPVYSPNEDKVIGKVEVLTALGSEEQINKLKSNRGFSSVKPKLSNFTQQSSRNPVPPSSELSSTRSSHLEKLRNLENLTNQDTDIETYSSRPDSRKGPHTNKIQQSSRIERNNLSKLSSKSQGASHHSKLHSTTDKVTEESKGVDIGTQSDMDGNKYNPPSTQDMLSSFMNQLIQQRQKNVCVENSTNTEPLDNEVNNVVSVEDARQKTNMELKRTSDLLDMLQNALNTDSKEREAKTQCCGQGKFNATVKILSANHLPGRKKCKPKNRSPKSEDILPSCYVTFETLIDSELYTTAVVSKSTSPVWNYTRDVTLSADLLTNGQKRLIFKVWRKSTNAVTCPNMQTDVVLGFAAVDLSVLLSGFPVIQGWYHIMDFCGKCNGQINIHITPLEDLSKYQSEVNAPKTMITDNSVQPQQEPSELLSRALKRKFVELDEITQRLRLRLSEVTNESDSSSDGMTEEFEKDINTLCVEDDFDTVNFEEEAKKIQNAVEIERNLENSGISLLMKDQDGKSVPSCSDLMSCSENSVANSADPASGISLDKTDGSVKNKYCDWPLHKEIADKETFPSEQPLDKQLQEGKQHINNLLEKLTLLSSGTVTSRYVSGCSTSGTNLDTEAILEELDHSSRPNIQSTLRFDPLNFQQLYGDSVLNPHSAQTSSSSLVTEFNVSRAPPEGEGESSDSVSNNTVLKND
ncbi:unnamed protein product [Callosobruchus maculatus]|nr:unnamed protein product [Callosobruchus maculatus]